MRKATTVRGLLVAVALVILFVPAAHAQIAGVEVGTSVTSLMIGLGDQSTTTFGMPSGGFGVINPGLYASLFLTPRIAIEPQIGLIVTSGNGNSAHVLNLAGQADYFLKGTGGNSPFVFGSLGLLSVSDADTTPISVSGGAGYRKLLGDRLSVRIDGRVTHFTDGLGNALSFTVSLGGIFGRP